MSAAGATRRGWNASVYTEFEFAPLCFSFYNVGNVGPDEKIVISSPYLLICCIEVTGAYGAQKTELNISLTAIGLLWTTTDFIAKGLVHGNHEKKETGLLQSIKRKGEKPEEQDKGQGRTPLVNVIDRDKLLFSVFSLLQKLGADDRPEVRNSSIRTLFQTLGTHGQKLSMSMWEDCLWHYVFPTMERVSHMAAASSTDEWHGKELGTRGGKAVHMLIHHSRNTAQKQWDETLVLVLGGIARLMRSFFPFLRSLSNFWTGWESLLLFVRNNILNGSKEVALAAINCLQTTVLSHSPKGNMPIPYLRSVLDVYEFVLQRSPSCSGIAASKVKQEILLGLGELYVQAQNMFDKDMYSQLLVIIHVAVRQPKSTIDSMEIDTEHVPPVQRTMLEILPQLRPSKHLSSMWLLLLRDLLRYLPLSENPSQDKEDETEDFGSTDHLDIGSLSDKNKFEGSNMIPAETHKMKSDFHNGVATDFQAQSPKSVSAKTKSMPVSILSHIFAEKLVLILVDLFQSAPAVEKYIIFPEIIQGLGRCMTTRRDNPDGALWRLAVEGFNRILVDDVCKINVDARPDSNITRLFRTRFWKEVADVYEVFLVGSCGRALPSKVLSAAMLKTDESLEMTILDVLGDKVLNTQTDAPEDILQRLISTLDRCASWTCCLPVETVELMPLHCSRFSLTCLEKLFSLCSIDEASTWSSTRSKVSRISIIVLMSRCEYILNKFLLDENDLGEHMLPALRIEEIIYILKELARLVIHFETASVLPLKPYLKEGLPKIESYGTRAHLLVLFPSFCELVISREGRVRELVQVLLRLITTDLGLQHMSLASDK